MDDKNFQINKKDLVSKFRALVKKHAERGDDYNPKHGKISANHRDYFVLDKIRAVYNWVIGDIKIELRRIKRTRIKWNEILTIRIYS